MRDGRRATAGVVEWRKQDVIAAAAACFMEKGYQATTIDDVAKRLDATKGRIYHHYSSKTDLFFAVHRQGMDRLFEAVEPESRRADTGLAVLERMLLAHAGAMMEHQALETVVAQGVQVHRFGSTTPAQRLVLDELIASRDRFEGLFKAQLKVAADDGSLAHLELSVTVKVLLGALQWSIYWYRPREGETVEDRERLAQAMVRPLVEGLRPRA